MLLVAATLLVLIGLAHSYLGERYILIRLFRRTELPRLFGSDWFTRRTLRFAWHLTTLTFWGFAAVLLVLDRAFAADLGAHVSLAVAVTFLAAALVALVASRGRHLSWIVFLAVAVLAFFGGR